MRSGRWRNVKCLKLNLKAEARLKEEMEELHAYWKPIEEATKKRIEEENKAFAREGHRLYAERHKDDE